MQEATAAEAERQYKAGQPVTEKVVDGVKKAVKSAKEAVSCAPDVIMSAS
jgi:hypothetical protein